MDSWVIPEHASNKDKARAGGLVGILAKIIERLTGFLRGIDVGG